MPIYSVMDEGYHSSNYLWQIQVSVFLILCTELDKIYKQSVLRCQLASKLLWQEQRKCGHHTKIGWVAKILMSIIHSINLWDILSPTQSSSKTTSSRILSSFSADSAIDRSRSSLSFFSERNSFKAARVDRDSSGSSSSSSFSSLKIMLTTCSSDIAKRKLKQQLTIESARKWHVVYFCISSAS